MWKLQKILSRLVLMAIQNAFERPHLNYGDVTNDEAYKEAFNTTIQYNEPFNIMLTQPYREILEEKN